MKDFLQIEKQKFQNKFENIEKNMQQLLMKNEVLETEKILNEKNL